MSNKKKVLVKGIISLSSEFAITVTLNPKMYAMEPIMQRNAIQGIMNSLSDECELSLICEFTQSYNIHLHGTVKVPLRKNTCVEYIVHNIFRHLKDIGHVCVKQLEDYEGWQQYCLKDYNKTGINLGENPVIIDKNGFFSPLVIGEFLLQQKISQDGTPYDTLK